MRLVCITGIDGTGKTTLARGVTRALRGESDGAAYIYGRTYPVLSRALMALGRMTLLRRHDQWQDYTSYTASKKGTMNNRLLAAVYTAAILADYYPQIWLKLLPHLLADRTVVCDRYIYDTVISDLAVHLNYLEERADRTIDRCMRLLPRPTLTVLLDVEPEVAFARKDDVPDVEYLRERRWWYRRLTERREVVVIDAERPSEEVQARVLDAVWQRVRGQTGAVRP